MIERIHWLGHGSFFIEGPPNIYINPWRITQPTEPADAILVGHDHIEHFSIADIHKLCEAGTRIIGNDRVAREFPSAEVIRPWQSMTLQRASIKAIPAYSMDGLQHRPEEGGLGFVISVHFYDIYYAGDTQLIPEMNRIRPDIAILPIDGNDTLTIEDAAVAVERLKPRWTIPSNWDAGTSGATPLDVLRFKRMVDQQTDVVAPVQRGLALRR